MCEKLERGEGNTFGWICVCREGPYMLGRGMIL